MPTSLDDWIAFYREGGAIMHGILALGVVGVLIGLERGWQLWVGQRVDVPRLMARVQSRLLAGDTAGALGSCTRGRSHVMRVVWVGLMHGVDPMRAEAAVREERLSVIPMLQRRLPALSAIASLATLLGLLGTVLGMIVGFSCAPLSAEARAKAIAASLGIAIHTSGFGIMVGIILLSLHLLLSSLRDQLVADIELSGTKVVNLIRIARAPGRGSAPPYRQCVE